MLYSVTQGHANRCRWFSLIVCICWRLRRAGVRQHIGASHRVRLGAVGHRRTLHAQPMLSPCL